MITKKIENGNLGSVLNLWYALVDDIQEIPLPVNGIVNQVAFKPGKSWHQIYLTQNTGGHDQNYIQDKGGSYDAKSIAGNVPGDDPENEAEIKKLKGKRFILAYQDANGRQRIIGDQKTPCSIGTKFSTGANFTTYQGSTIEFKTQSTKGTVYIQNIVSFSGGAVLNGVLINPGGTFLQNPDGTYLLVP